MNKIDKVKAHFLKFGQLDSWDAIQVYGVTRLADTVYKLKARGFNIETQRLPNSGGTGGTYAVYHLKPASK
tara:strand:+ start:333 stop:545 length:213 start_codon:yes stop_codon:yes gene_type:complete